MILPLHGMQCGQSISALSIGAVRDLPAEFTGAISIRLAMDPGAESVFTPDGRIVTGDDLRGLPYLFHDMTVISPLRFQGDEIVFFCVHIGLTCYA